MIRRLKAVHSILSFLNNDREGSYIVKEFIGKAPEEEREEICNVLNELVEAGEARYEKGGETYKHKIDLTANNINDGNVVFRLDKELHVILLSTLCKVLDELSDWQQSIEAKVDRLDEVDEKTESIKETAEMIGKVREEIGDIEEELLSKEEKFEKDIAKKGCEIEKQASEQAAKEVKKEIDEALTRSGSIGSFLQEIQKDVIQYMAIFIAVFSLVNINIGGGEKRSLTDFLGINLLMVSAMVTMFALLFVVLRRPASEGKSNRESVLLWVVAILLWIITVIAFISVQCAA